MPLPNVLARPIFHSIYTYMRRKEGATVPPIRRKVMPVDPARKQVFDILLDMALAGDPRKPIPSNLSYPKAEFLNYICDWRGLVLHGSTLRDLDVLEPISVLIPFWIGSMVRSKSGAAHRLSGHWLEYASRHVIFPILTWCNSRFNVLLSYEYPVYYEVPHHDRNWRCEIQAVNFLKA